MIAKLPAVVLVGALAAPCTAQAPSVDVILRYYHERIEWVRDSGGNGHTCMTAQGEVTLDHLVQWLTVRAVGREI